MNFFVKIIISNFSVARNEIVKSTRPTIKTIQKAERIIYADNEDNISESLFKVWLGVLKTKKLPKKLKLCIKIIETTRK
jgi:hypothetical protein